MVLGVDVDLVLDFADLRADGTRAVFEQIRATRQQRRVPHPQKVRGKLVGDLGWPPRLDDHIAAADVDFCAQGQRDRLPGAGAIEIAIGADDARHS